MGNSAERPMEFHIVDPGQLAQLSDLAALVWYRYLMVTEATQEARGLLYDEKQVPQWLRDKIEEMF